MPLVPLTLISFSELVNYYMRNRYPVSNLIITEMIDDFLFVSVAFGWNYLAFRHFDLNNISLFTAAKKSLLYALTFLLYISIILIYLYNYNAKTIIHVLIIILLFHAAGKAVFFHFKVKNPLPSSRTAVNIAIISLIVYPVIIIGNISGWSLPFFDNDISFWVQAHPVYVIFVNIPVLFFLLNTKSIPDFISTLPDGDSIISSYSELLSDREKEIFLLLYHGKRYKEIADSLFISVSTVKTHINHIYKKLDISRREDLYRKMLPDSEIY
jgi:DNA-binding CsgD family transcriptional regulator